MVLTKYNFSVGQIVTNKIPLTDENEVNIPVGSKLRIVAIAPKVFYTKKKAIQEQMVIQDNSRLFDNRVYFFNAVRAEQKEDYGNRIRAHFVTIKKV